MAKKERNSKKEKKPTKPLTIKQTNIYHIVTIVLLILTNVVFCAILLYINRVSTLSKNIFLLLNIGIVLFLLLMNVLGIYIYFRRTKTIVKQLMIGILVIFVAAGGYGAYFVNSLFTNIDKVITTGETQNEERSVAFVTYNNSNIKSINHINGKKVGIIDNINFIEGNVLALEEIANQALKVDLVEYTNYLDLLQGLFAGEVDVAALPENYVVQYQSNEGFEEYLDRTNVIHTYSKTVTMENENKTDIDVTKDPFTILIIGNDGHLSDALMVATVNPTNMVMTLTSIPRDSYVPIACYSGNNSDKITHARGVSLQCTVDTVEDLLDIDINFYVEVSFQGVVDIVDALGKIDVYSPATFVGQNASNIRGTYTVWVEEGLHPRTGEQVLAIARERKTAGFDDFVRQKNQQNIISALIKKVMNMRSPSTAINVFNAAGDNIRTNMSMNQMLSLLNMAIEDMDNSALKNANILTLQSTRLYGYASYTYNEGLEQPIWIYKLFEGSITDNSNFIKQRLRIGVTPEIPHTFRYLPEWGYGDQTYVATWYNEQQTHEQMPDFVLNFKGSSLSEVEAWARARNISVVINRIEPGNGAYNSSYAQNTVIGQDQKYGRKVSNINSITVDVIKHPVNCELTEFAEEPECRVVPNLVGKSLSDDSYKKFIDRYNIKPKIVYIMPGEQGYDSSKAGLIASTNPSSGSNAFDGMSFTVTIYVDPNNVVKVENFASKLKEEFDTFCNNNGLTQIATNTTEITTDENKIGKTYVVSNETGDVIKNGGSVKVTYVTYTKGITVPIITDPPAAVPGLSFTRLTVDTDDETKNGQIASQSHASGSIVAEGTTITYTVYVYKAPDTGDEGN